MRKRDELTDPNSCMSRARDDEWTFVLLGRDCAAPVAVQAWVDERVRLGKNKPDEPQIIEAMQWILQVLAEHHSSPPLALVPCECSTWAREASNELPEHHPHCPKGKSSDRLAVVAAVIRLRRFRAGDTTVYNPTNRATPEAIVGRIWADEGRLADAYLKLVAALELLPAPCSDQD